MKMRTPHIVPVATQALEVLSLLRALTGHSEWLFPGDRFGLNGLTNSLVKPFGRSSQKGRTVIHLKTEMETVRRCIFEFGHHFDWL